MKQNKSAFTLIELLIVIAIIAILALIAIPNFLEAQTRSKVARAMADMRSAATALEAYFVDNNVYPPLAGYKVCVDNGNPKSEKTAPEVQAQYNRGGILLAWQLSTPIAYITSTRLPDPFCNIGKYNDLGEVIDNGDQSFTLTYCNVELYRKVMGTGIPNCKWGLLSLGPDFTKGPNPFGGAWTWSNYCAGDVRDVSNGVFRAWGYDPSNGTISGGDIMRWQIQ
ncbi:MAG: prepilin-type N-terminal cleavage/methylation domain-containing protein [Candidatus Sumerlaeota bacterium]|nr:prepilin-type N-terminal cleavage/methylation domain-containing protein [Candidatus Sumerlaeota bacterium]